jgi:hypothetical protein
MKGKQSGYYLESGLLSFTHWSIPSDQKGHGPYVARRRDTQMTWWPKLTTINHGLHNYFSLNIPIWFIVAPSFILFVVTIGPVLRTRRREKLVRCLRCGYDLRGTPGRCPECGLARWDEEMWE